jgi:hypothetical protein
MISEVDLLVVIISHIIQDVTLLISVVNLKRPKY